MNVIMCGNRSQSFAKVCPREPAALNQPVIRSLRMSACSLHTQGKVQLATLSLSSARYFGGPSLARYRRLVFDDIELLGSIPTETTVLGDDVGKTTAVLPAFTLFPAHLLMMHCIVVLACRLWVVF